MTPLARRVARELTVPARDRVGEDRGGILHLMNDIHCFDVTGVWEIVCDLAEKIDDRTVAGSDYLTFLPAPRTWIEMGGPGGRVAYLLVESPSRDRAEVYSVVTEAEDIARQLHMTLPKDWWSANRQTDLALRRPHIVESGRQIDRDMDAWIGVKEQAVIYALLLVINSPKVIGRRQHAPHRGLERRLLRQARRSGTKFAVNAWTEVHLHVTTHDLTEAGSHEDHLTGRRALHWVRTFGRIRLGRLEIVRSHWRGDPDLGIRQSRYIVEP